MPASRPKFRKLLLPSLLAAMLAVPGKAQDWAPPDEPGKNIWLAYGLALGGTALPVLLGANLAGSTHGALSTTGAYMVLGGLAFGPATGQFYASSVGAGIVSSMIRSAGIGMGIVGLVSVFPVTLCEEFAGEEDGCEEEEREDYGYLIALGAVTYLGGLAYSLVDTHLAVENHRYRQAKKRMGLTPTLDLNGRGGLRPGALAYLRF